VALPETLKDFSINVTSKRELYLRIFKPAASPETPAPIMQSFCFFIIIYLIK
jgi:hypothetical protein